MTTDWNMAAVATALAIFVAPVVWKATHTALSTVQKKTRKVMRFKWDNIPDGKIYEFGVPGFYGLHDTSHAAEQRCWESETGVAIVYNRAWKLATRKPQFANQIPDALAPSISTICTDSRTLLAFILATASETKGGDWNQAVCTYGRSKLSCERWNGIIFCHVQGSFPSRRVDLTKNELERMLEGYPPWYRDCFVTWAKFSLAFPIHNLSDVSRGGWIVAVGLMNTYIESQAPLALYRCQDEPKEPEFRSNGVVYRKAIARCLEHITRNLEPHFPQDVNVKAAVTMLSYLLTERTASGIPCPGQFSATRSSSTQLPQLKSSDCIFLMENFNKFRALDIQGKEKERLEGILLPAMAAVVHGAVEVVQYLKDVGIEFKFPDELADFNQEVYLKDCVTKLPLN
jgi:hypothetical protein